MSLIFPTKIFDLSRQRSLPVPIRQPSSLPPIAGSVVFGNLRGVPEFVELGSDERVELP
jgi:hypothetical protein